MTEKQRTQKRRAPRGGILPFLLAWILLITTLTGAFSSFSPMGKLRRAAEKTREEMAGEELLGFLSRALWDGSFEAEGEKTSLSYTATLPGGASFVMTGDAGRTRVGAVEDRIFLESPVLGKGSFSAIRKGSADFFADSAFSDAGSTEELRVIRSLCALSDPDSEEGKEHLAGLVAELFDEAGTKFETEKTEIKLDRKMRKATEYRFTASREGIERALKRWSELGKEKKTEEALSALHSLFAALSGAPTSQKEGAVSFLSGKGDAFGAWKKELLSKDSSLVLSLRILKGRVVGGDLVLKGGDFSLKVSFSVSANYEKDGKCSLSAVATKGEGELFSCKLSSAITENTKSALIRKWSYSFTDGCGILFPETVSEQGEAVFSWGKEKDDLGFKFLLGETQWSFRGELKEYKKGKELSFVLNRAEKNRKVLFGGEALSVTVLDEGETPTLPKGESAFPSEGEPRQKLAELISAYAQHYGSEGN